jgi:hypothetical protein
MLDWLARVALGVVLDRMKKWLEEWLEYRAGRELKERADAQIIREHTPLDDDALDKRLRDGKG